MLGPRKPRIKALKDLPAPDPGHSDVVLLSNEFKTFLLYRIAEAPEHGSAKLAPEWHPEGEDLYAVLELVGCTSMRFGFPNDEALHGHPLWDRGMSYYSAAEVLRSPWPDELAQQNRVHPSHDDAMFKDLRHLLFTFHDTTFECLCSRYTAEPTREPRSALIARLAARL